MIDYQAYVKGKIYKEWIGIPEGPHFEYSDGIARVCIHVHSDIIEECELGKPYCFALTSFEETIFMCLRWNIHDYISMPFNPNLCKKFKHLDFNDEKGLQVVILLINIDTGELVDINYCVLGTEISRKFMEECERIKGSGIKLHYSEIDRVYRTYKTDKEIADLGVKFRID